MPSQLLSSQKGAEGAGGPRAPQIALSRTHHLAGGPSPKNLKDYVVTIGKALERLNLGVCVCVCVYLFNGRRPVPITRVLNIPCWDKSRQVVRPGLQYLYT